MAAGVAAKLSGPARADLARHERQLEKSSADIKNEISKGVDKLRKLLDAREFELHR